MELLGEEDRTTLVIALNYASNLSNVGRFEEARSLLRKNIPVAQRVLGENHEFALRMRAYYAGASHMDACATLGDLRKAVATLEELVSTTRRVFGGAHPLAMNFEESLRRARAALRAREE